MALTDNKTANQSPPQRRPIQPLQQAQSKPADSPPAAVPPPSRTPRGAAKRRSGGPAPRSLTQVLKEADQMVVQGELDEYLPIPCGFDQIDRLIGGGEK